MQASDAQMGGAGGGKGIGGGGHWKADVGIVQTKRSAAPQPSARHARFLLVPKLDAVW